MKNFIVVFALFALTLTYGNVCAQEDKDKKADEPKDLQGAITGKWELTDMTTNKPAGVWDFQTDGNFKSTGHYLSTKDASFRTNEGRSVVFIQVGEEVTEWKVTMKDDSIILKEVTAGKKSKPAKFLLKKIEVGS